MQKLKLGIIGCGWVRAQHMAGLFEEAPEFAVTAACDLFPATLGKFCDRYAIADAYATPQGLFAKAGVDAVSIAVKPESAKVALAIEAMERGLHVLAEKPMALTVREAEAMAAAARRTGRVLQIGLNRRFEPVYQQVVAWIRDTQNFGEVATAAIDYGSASAFPYVQFMAQFPHTFDLIQYFAGPVTAVRSLARRVLDPSAFAEQERQLGHPSEVEYNRTEPGLVALSVASTLAFASGAIGTLRLSGHAPPGRVGPDRFEIVGTRRVAIVVENVDRAIRIDAEGRETVVSSTSWSRKVSSFGLEYRHFAGCIRGNAPSVVTVEDGLRSVRLYEAFLRSLQTDAAVAV